MKSENETEQESTSRIPRPVDETLEASPVDAAWERLDRLFVAALARPDAQRDEFLDDACRGEPELRAQLEALLADDAELGDILETPLAPAAVDAMAGDPADRQGTTLGPYRLLGRLGTGGMGTVYLAEQREPVERRVALKLIRPGMASPEVLARFVGECQAMALMDHANIARVFDAGTTTAGRPFLAMEYVPGPAIHTYCDRHELGLRERAELFLQVCDGVQHAHQKGLIHRDLKPSNLLVKSAAGQPARVKIIDFGVAKSLQRALSADAVRTRVGTFVGTPVYSSPEQIGGRFTDTDTRSDIYSLGVVLYELLVGAPPFASEEFEGKSPLEISHMLDAREPPTPRARFGRLAGEREGIAERRSLTVDALQRQLGRDIAWILMKCLERGRADRYSSVSELRKDLERCLADQPIEARPASALYRLRKTVRRHRTAVVAASAFTLALLATTSAAVFGFLHAENEAAAARRAAYEAERAAMFQEEQLRAVDPASMAVDLRAGLRRAVRDRWLDRGLAADDAQARRAQLDGLLEGVSFTDLVLSLLDDSLFERARVVIETRYDETPLLQARLWQSLADTVRTVGRWEDAVEPQARALELRRDVLGPEHPLTLASLRGRGQLHLDMGRLDDAALDLEEALAIGRRVQGDTHLDTLRAVLLLGEVQYHRGDFARGESLSREALDGMRRTLGDAHPETLGAMNNLAVFLVELDRLEEAESLHREALSGRRRVLGIEHPETLESFGNTALLLGEMGRLSEAESYFREALETKRRVLGNEHPKTLRTISTLGAFLCERGRFEEAEPHVREALDTRRRVLGADHRDTLISMVGLGDVLAGSGQAVAAEAQYRTAIRSMRRALGREHLDTLYAVAKLADALRGWGRPEDALALSRDVIRSARRTEPESRHLGRWLMGHSESLAALGRVDEAVDVLDEACALLAATSVDAARPAACRSARAALERPGAVFVGEAVGESVSERVREPVREPEPARESATASARL